MKEFFCAGDRPPASCATHATSHMVAGLGGEWSDLEALGGWGTAGNEKWCEVAVICDKWAAGVVCCDAALIGERRMGKLDVLFDLCVAGVNDLQWWIICTNLTQLDLDVCVEAIPCNSLICTSLSLVCWIAALLRFPENMCVTAELTPMLQNSLSNELLCQMIQLFFSCFDKKLSLLSSW
jgi:hypothetical protein